MDNFSHYILVKWPESQEYMDKKWFNAEAILASGHETSTGYAAYFIPISLIDPKHLKT